MYLQGVRALNMRGTAISRSSLLCRSMLKFINSLLHYLTFEAGFTFLIAPPLATHFPFWDAFAMLQLQCSVFFLSLYPSIFASQLFFSSLLLFLGLLSLFGLGQHNRACYITLPNSEKSFLVIVESDIRLCLQLIPALDTCTLIHYPVGPEGNR